MNKIGKPLRLFFIVSSTVSWLGLWLTGFSNAHWLLYIAPIAFLLAGITGYCPGITFSTKLFPKEKTTN